MYNVGGLLFSLNLRYFDNMTKGKYLVDEMSRLDKDGQLLQRFCTIVDDVGAQKKVEDDILYLYPELDGVEPLLQKYPNVGQQYISTKLRGRDLRKFRESVRDCYATGFLSDKFYTDALKKKLECNKHHTRKQEKLLKFAQIVGTDR